MATMYNNGSPIQVILCDSGLILRMSDVQQLSLRPFEDDDKIVERLRGIEDGTALYLKTNKNGVQKLSLNNRFHLDYHYPNGANVDPQQLLKKMITSWLSYHDRSSRDE